MSVYTYLACCHHQLPVRRLCAVLGVSASAYYAWHAQQRAPAPVSATEQAVVKAFTDHAARYGTRRLRHELRAQGHHLGRARIAHVLRRHGLRAQQPRSFVPQTTDSSHGRRVAPNRLLNQPAPTAPNQVWVGDITYLPRQGGGWFYLAAWLDRYSRRVVGWDVRTTMPADLVCESLRRALVVRQPAPGLLVHSDQGSQYTADDFSKLLHGHRAVASMSRKGNCYDNAHAESFWSRLKTELLDGGSFPDLETARLEISHYVTYYNTVRRHSALDYQAPANFESQYSTTS